MNFANVMRLAGFCLGIIFLIILYSFTGNGRYQHIQRVPGFSEGTTTVLDTRTGIIYFGGTDDGHNIKDGPVFGHIDMVKGKMYGFIGNFDIKPK